MNVEFEPAAVEDLKAACAFYDLQSPGLGDRFAHAVFAELSTVASHPLASPSYFEVWRKARPKRFPYVILFEVEAERIVVTAIVHAHRDPGFIERRLDPESEGNE